MNRSIYVSLGALLTVLFMIQNIMDIRWVRLHELQQVESFRRWSGLGLLVYILLQWSLTLAKSVPRFEEKILFFKTAHIRMGAFAPLVFYIHSMKFGFAYLLVLAITYFVNFLIGMVNREVIKVQDNWYYQGWMISHVALSMVISFLSIYHIWIVFYYK